MKIFISWSGQRSKAVAQALKSWIKMVLQATEPWVSTEDIERGSVWFSQIAEQLKTTQVGIICLTPENLDEPWILFEAGAIAKGMESNRVCTLLIGLAPTEVKPPLSQFNATLLTKEGLHQLLLGLNRQLPQPLADQDFTSVFNAMWPTLEPVIQEAAKARKSVPKTARSSEDMLKELLGIARKLEQRISSGVSDLAENDFINVPDLMALQKLWDTKNRERRERGLRVRALGEGFFPPASPPELPERIPPPTT